MFDVINEIKKKFNEEKEKEANALNSKNSTDDLIDVPTEVLLEFKTPERPKLPYPKSYLKRALLLVALLALFFASLQDYVAVIFIIGSFAAVYVFFAIPPHEVTHKITNNGINYAGDSFYKWHELSDFFYDSREDVDLLVVNTKSPLPGRLFIIIPEHVDKEIVRSILNKHLSFLEVAPPNTLEKFNKKIMSKFQF